MKIGYARVSTRRQRFELQHKALFAAGCSFVVSEVASGKDDSRIGLRTALALMAHGDQLVVWKLDRLGREPFALMDLARALRQAGLGLTVTAGQGASIDIATPEGLGLFTIYAGSAAIEHEAIVERSRAGSELAKPSGSSKRNREPLQARRRERADRPTESRRRLKSIFNGRVEKAQKMERTPPWRVGRP
jgi:serine recombinase